METFACLAALACCGFVAAAIDIILGAELLLAVYGAENVRMWICMGQSPTQ